MKKIIALRIISLTAIALGMFLLIAGAASGVKPLKYKKKITYTEVWDSVNVNMEARAKGVFGPKEMNIRIVVYDTHNGIMEEKVFKVKCGHEETYGETFYHKETKNVPYRIDVKIDSYKMNNTPPIVIGSILFVLATLVFVWNEIYWRKKCASSPKTK